MNLYYAIRRGGKYLQAVEPNPLYKRNAVAPTMGRAHGYVEYRTVWSDKITAFERLTAADYIKTLMEEYRWGYKKPMDFKVVCVKKEGDGWAAI